MKIVLALMLAAVFMAAGCAKQDRQLSSTNEAAGAVQDGLKGYDAGKAEEHMKSAEERAREIRTSLERDELTQADMNEKSQELYEVWDGAMKELLSALENVLPEKELARLQDEQQTWSEEKDEAVKEAGKEFEGGSVYPLIVNSEAAQRTEERVYALYELLKEVS